ncbi:MAG: RNA recognition motif domain-containing protein [Bdellovibrionia bacterium]
MKLYVGNLAYTCTDEDLNQLFGEFGAVEKAYIVKDRESQRSKGFGFVEMGDSEGQTAISELNGREFMGRNLNVSEARPPAQGDRGPRRSFGGPRREGGGNGPRRGGFRGNE